MKSIIFALARVAPKLAYWLMVVINILYVMTFGVVGEVMNDVRLHWRTVVIVPSLVFSGAILASGVLLNSVLVTAICTGLIGSVYLAGYIITWLMRNGLFVGPAAMISATRSFKENSHA